jgi:hypothetical protein
MTIGFPVTVYPSKSIVTNGVDYLHGVASGAEVRIDGGNLFQAGNQTSIMGSKMKVERLIADNDLWPIENEAGAWPSSKTFAHVAISKSFDSSYDGAYGPTIGLFLFTNNDGATGHVTSIIGDAVMRVDGGTIFGANFIARSGAGASGIMVGMELDVEPAPGTFATAGSNALAVNAFSTEVVGNVIQVGALGGGLFQNGIGLAFITGAGLYGIAGGSLGSLINTGLATYTGGAAIVMSNTHKIRLNGTSTAHGYLYMDSSNNERMVLGSGSFIIRDNTDISSLFTFASSGVLTCAAISTTVEYRVNGTKVLGARDTGWTAMTGSTNKATAYDTSTVTLAQLAGRVMALQAALTTHGAIGA